MGLFLSMSGIANATAAEVKNSLRQYAVSHGGSLTECEATDNSSDFLILSERQRGRITVVYPSGFTDWEGASAHISRSLSVPVFFFHIHDGDLWMYVLYFHGEDVGRFNPVPAYWSGEISDADRESWRGDASVIAKYWPDSRIETIEKYLVPWNLDDESPGTAYPGDEFNYGDSWQMLDFMKRLELDYPIDDRGQAHGETFRFEVK